MLMTGCMLVYFEPHCAYVAVLCLICNASYILILYFSHVSLVAFR